MCGMMFDVAYPYLHSCKSCIDEYGRQQNEIAESILNDAVPEALNVLGFSSVQDYRNFTDGDGADDNGVVYFIQQGDGGLIKIGTSTDVKQRLSVLQTSSGEPLHLLATMPGGKTKESEIHGIFADYRRLGEWFYPAKELLDFIKTV